MAQNKRDFLVVIGRAKEDKKPLAHEEFKGDDGDFIECYDGETYMNLTIKEVKDIRRNPNNGDYVVIDKRTPKETLKEAVDRFKIEANVLKAKTGGLINMYRTGGNLCTMKALLYDILNRRNFPILRKNNKRLEKLNRPKIGGQLEAINDDEAKWLERATIGAMEFYEKYRGEVYVYDKNSMYPSWLKSNYLMIPIQRGSFLKMKNDSLQQKIRNSINNTNKDDMLQIGIYRCVIEVPKKEQMYKLFKVNDDEYYTHYEIKWAYELGLKITLKEDNRDNALIYERNKCKTGAEIFKQYVDILYPLRQDERVSDIAKIFLSRIWGALSQKTERQMVIPEGETVNFLPKDISYDSNGNMVVTYSLASEYYWTQLARLKPFLLSKVRVDIGKTIQPHKEHILKSYCDSMYSDIPLDLELSKDIGKWKIEKQCNDMEIVNSRKNIIH